MGMIRDYLNDKSSKYLKGDDKEPIGIGGYVAGVRLKEDTTYTSNVTTNTVEDGAEINDHIINNPIIVNIEGEIGDVEKKPDPLIQAYKKAMRNVGVVTKYLPKRTQGQISKINSTVLKINDLLNKVDSIIDDGMQIYRLFKPLDTKSEQEKFFKSGFVATEMVKLSAVDMALGDCARSTRTRKTTKTTGSGSASNQSSTLTALYSLI
jgi:hypothetical protein